MTDPGYGPNGVRIDVAGRIEFAANGPIVTVNEGDDVWTIYPLGVVAIPFVSQSDDEAVVFNYIGGVL